MLKLSPSLDNNHQVDNSSDVFTRTKKNGPWFAGAVVSNVFYCFILLEQILQLYTVGAERG